MAQPFRLPIGVGTRPAGSRNVIWTVGVELSWTDRAWDDYPYWQTQDRKTLKRINALIADINRDPDEHRLVYAVEPDEITIISCSYHYARPLDRCRTPLDPLQVDLS